ncbi:hypothetical protein [Microbacterium sp. NPDC064584]|uniref:hypothetical protein n=1 Tax=Microbacterium sp. NPDC064584 TaxID=3155817 RepID=UPI003414A13D
MREEFEPAAASEKDRKGGLSRRSLLIGGAVGAASIFLPTAGAFAAPDYSVIPKLPYEVSRMDTQVSSSGKKKYEVIDILFSGDTTRLFVPHTAKLGKQATALTFVWFYHAFGSTYTAISSAYKWSAMLAVDKGWVSVCPNYGGDQWVNAKAIWLQGEISRYINSYFNVKASYMRANSGGGSLMSYAYGKRYIPSPKGMYLANATYDMEDLYARDPARVGPAYGGDVTKVVATNPAKLYAPSAWAGTRIRAVVSAADVVVPPAQHGEALVKAASPFAAETSLVWHAGGHTVPASADSDCISTFARWQSA